MNGEMRLAILGIVAACGISFINYLQYKNLANRMEDLEVTVEMELFPDLAFPQINTQEAREKEEPDWWEEDPPSPCETGCLDGERCPSFKSSM